jgi:hypothetical protein
MLTSSTHTQVLLDAEKSYLEVQLRAELEYLGEIIGRCGRQVSIDIYLVI